jgi:hypothetical protein
MSPFSSEEFARRVVRNVQIIVFALAAGPIVFAGIALFQRMNQPPQQDHLLAYLAAGFAVTALASRIFIGKATVANQRERIAAGSWSIGTNASPAGLPVKITDGDRLLFVFQQKTIIESAIVEGAAFFVIVSFLIAGQGWSLAVAGVLVLVNLFPFPTHDRVENWVRYQLEFMELEKR